MIRKIIHIDMDCFYAAIEIRDKPVLSTQPVAVGGSAGKRGVLSTCNYIARQFGLHSAMPTAKALALCPQLILLPITMEKYRQVSQEIHAILQNYSPIIEPISLDEAYLDVTDNKRFRGSASWLARHIRATIENKTQLTASAGIAPNKLLAKIASDWNKPNGQYLIAPDQVNSFIQNLPIEKIPGVGAVTTKKLHRLNIFNCQQLQCLSKTALIDTFGHFGGALYEYSRGTDHRPLETHRVRKSVSVELTFSYNLSNVLQCEHALPTLYQRLCQRLEKHANRKIHKQFIKIKWANFTQITRECTVSQLAYDTFLLLLHEATTTSKQSIRLLGLGIRFHQPGCQQQQYELF